MNTIQKRIIKANEGLTQTELLNWAMNQLFRAAREIDLLKISAGYEDPSLAQQGCDATATVILKRLVKTKHGYRLVQRTNKKLLRGYKKP